MGGTIKKSTIKKGEQEITILKENLLCQGKISVFESVRFEKVQTLNKNIYKSKALNIVLLKLKGIINEINIKGA